MTRIDYALIASAIRDTRLTEGGKARLVDNMLDVLSRNSHTFNKEKFVSACYADNSRTRLGNSI
jgi:hypothetical protein